MPRDAPYGLLCLGRSGDMDGQCRRGRVAVPSCGSRPGFVKRIRAPVSCLGDPCRLPFVWNPTSVLRLRAPRGPVDFALDVIR